MQIFHFIRYILAYVHSFVTAALTWILKKFQNVFPLEGKTVWFVLAEWVQFFNSFIYRTFNIQGVLWMVNRILIKGKILDMKIPIFEQLQELVDKLQ